MYENKSCGDYSDNMILVNRLAILAAFPQCITARHSQQQPSVAVDYVGLLYIDAGC